jgi:GAF domain-containing protein
MRLFAVEEFNGAACLISRVAVGTSATSGYHVIEFDLKSQMTEGHLGRCALSGSPAIVIEPAYSSDAHTSPAEELNHRNLAFIPVRDGRGRVLAVLRAADRFSDESAFAKRNSLVDPSVGYLATAFEGVVLSTQSQSSIPASPSQHMLLPMDFNHSDIELLTAVASQSASVLQRARALETDSKQRRQTEALLRISALANNTAKPPVPDHSILPRIVDAAYMLIPSGVNSPG